MDSRKTCADVQSAQCRGSVDKRKHKTCGRTKDAKRQNGKWVVFVFRVGEKCGRRRAREEKKTEERRSTTNWGGTR